MAVTAGVSHGLVGDNSFLSIFILDEIAMIYSFT